MKTFIVTDDEVNKMLDVLSKANRGWDPTDVRSLSKKWIRAVMSQPSKNNKQRRRPFEYSKKKIQDYLDWRTKSSITSKISHHLSSSTTNGEELAALTKSPGAFYWHGVDKEGSPILWYHSNLMNFDSKIVVKDEMEFSAITMQAAIDAMPDNIHNFNFVILFDIFDPLKAIKHPKLAPAFIKTFMKVSPDRLKRGIFLTGTLGHIFYKIAKHVASASIMEKVVEVRNRNEVSDTLVGEGVIDEQQIPTFLGGSYAHDEDVTSCFPKMIETIKIEMKDFEQSSSSSSAR